MGKEEILLRAVKDHVAERTMDRAVVVPPQPPSQFKVAGPTINNRVDTKEIAAALVKFGDMLRPLLTENREPPFVNVEPALVNVPPPDLSGVEDAVSRVAACQELLASVLTRVTQAVGTMAEAVARMADEHQAHVEMLSQLVQVLSEQPAPVHQNVIKLPKQPEVPVPPPVRKPVAWRMEQRDGVKRIVPEYAQ